MDILVFQISYDDDSPKNTNDYKYKIKCE